ncbi:MAG TPA: zinc-dependent peptidase [Chryseosolibacter sp.]|nr:zinc-dependent peptidase [Chryseosolibacter sp.]
MIPLLIISCLVAFVAYRFQQEVQKGYQYAERRAAPVKTWILPVPRLYKDILQKYFPYYQALSAANKVKFERKVCNFLYSKRFIPRNAPEVSIEAKVLIAASACQLTFGLPDIYLRHFDKILVYPNEYYSSITRQYHKGEVNPRFGIIVLSWKNFLEGIVSDERSVNLGLHEMAHALRLENIIRNEEYRFFDDDLIRRFDEYARGICKDVKRNGAFFRPYACTNEHEFFSVAIENFFDRSELFRKELPDLYSILTRLLRQDPLKLTQA